MGKGNDKEINVFRIDNPFFGKKPKQRALAFWYARLWEIAISCFQISGQEFEGPDATMNERYLLFKLLERGYAGITKDREGKLRGLECTRIGYDPYMMPTNLTFSNAVLGTFNREVNKTAVLMPANRIYQPVIYTIKKYARQIAEIDTTLDVNVINVRTTKIFPVSSDPEAQQVRRMMEDVENGLPATLKKNILRDSIMQKNGVPAYSLAENYFADKMIQDIRSKIAEFLNIFGVNTSGANQVKAERNLVSEVHSNDQEIEVNRYFWLQPMRAAFDRCRDLWGVDWRIDIVGRGSEDGTGKPVATKEPNSDPVELPPEN